MSENASTTQGLTRRELLKRGAALGGALAWATPAVQMIGMQRAMATHVSDLCICVKFDGSDDSNHWTAVGNLGTGQGTCLPSFPSGCDNYDPSGDDTFQAGNCLGTPDTFCIEKDDTTGIWTLYFPLYCELVAAWAKCGQDPGCENLLTSGAITPLPDGDTKAVEIDPCPSQSHFEFCFDCV